VRSAIKSRRNWRNDDLISTCLQRGFRCGSRFLFSIECASFSPFFIAPFTPRYEGQGMFLAKISPACSSVMQRLGSNQKRRHHGQHGRRCRQ